MAKKLTLEAGKLATWIDRPTDLSAWQATDAWLCSEPVPAESASIKACLASGAARDVLVYNPPPPPPLPPSERRGSPQAPLRVCTCLWDRAAATTSEGWKTHMGLHVRHLVVKHSKKDLEAELLFRQFGIARGSARPALCPACNQVRDYARYLSVSALVEYCPVFAASFTKKYKKRGPAAAPAVDAVAASAPVAQAAADKEAAEVEALFRDDDEAPVVPAAPEPLVMVPVQEEEVPAPPPLPPVTAEEEPQAMEIEEAAPPVALPVAAPVVVTGTTTPLLPVLGQLASAGTAKLVTPQGGRVQAHPFRPHTLFVRRVTQSPEDSLSGDASSTFLDRFRSVAVEEAMDTENAATQLALFPLALLQQALLSALTLAPLPLVSQLAGISTLPDVKRLAQTMTLDPTLLHAHDRLFCGRTAPHGTLHLTLASGHTHPVPLDRPEDAWLLLVGQSRLVFGVTECAADCTQAVLRVAASLKPVKLVPGTDDGFYVDADKTRSLAVAPMFLPNDEAALEAVENRAEHTQAINIVLLKVSRFQGALQVVSKTPVSVFGWVGQGGRWSLRGLQPALAQTVAKHRERLTCDQAQMDAVLTGLQHHASEQKQTNEYLGVSQQYMAFNGHQLAQKLLLRRSAIVHDPLLEAAPHTTSVVDWLPMNTPPTLNVGLMPALQQAPHRITHTLNPRGLIVFADELHELDVRMHRKGAYCAVLLNGIPFVVAPEYMPLAEGLTTQTVLRLTRCMWWPGATPEAQTAFYDIYQQPQPEPRALAKAAHALWGATVLGFEPAWLGVTTLQAVVPQTPPPSPKKKKRARNSQEEDPHPVDVAPRPTKMARKTLFPPPSPSSPPPSSSLLLPAAASSSAACSMLDLVDIFSAAGSR